MSDAPLFNYAGFYARMAARLDLLTYVELGVHDGASLCFLAQALGRRKDDWRLWGVDRWDGTAGGEKVDSGTLRACIARMDAAGVPRHDYTLVVADAIHASRVVDPWRSIDFVFLDADHSYEHVRDCISAWLPRIRPGGIVAGHDVLEPSCGVKQAVDEAFGGDYQIEHGCWFRTA